MSEEARRKKLALYIEEIAVGAFHSHPQVKAALDRIKGVDRKLLALHRYLHFMLKYDIDERWAWTREEIETWKHSEEAKSAKSAIGKVVSKFNSLPESARNSYRLSGGSDPRDLEEQIWLWNRNGSVETIGAAMRKKAYRVLERPEYPDVPDMMARLRFGAVLIVEWPKGICGNPTNATPGLSAHGQMRAVDFHVKQNGVKIASSGGKSFWKSSGLADLLKRAVEQANRELGGSVFKGPLTNPDEPWHYSYSG